MAKQAIITYVDDYDGQPIEDGDRQHVTFTWQGGEYAMDLSTDNYTKLTETLGPWLDSAMQTRKPPRKRTRTHRDPSQTKAIREWAQANGYEISDRGRIPAEIEAAYNDSQ